MIPNFGMIAWGEGCEHLFSRKSWRDMRIISDNLIVCVCIIQ